MPGITAMKSLPPAESDSFTFRRETQQINFLLRENRLTQASIRGLRLSMQASTSQQSSDKVDAVSRAYQHLFQRALATNQFEKLQEAVLQCDPSLKKVERFIDSLKSFLLKNKALDLLYNYCIFSGDFVSAGVVAIHLAIYSRSWDSRIGHLQNAQRHLTAHHSKISQGGVSNISITNHGTALQQPVGHHGLSLSSAGRENSGAQLESIGVGCDRDRITRPTNIMTGEPLLLGEVNQLLTLIKFQIAVCEALPMTEPEIHLFDLENSTN